MGDTDAGATDVGTTATDTHLSGRRLRVLGWATRGLVWTAAFVLAFAAYQLWGTGIEEARAQDDLRAEFESQLAAAVVDRPASDRSPPVPSSTVASSTNSSSTTSSSTVASSTTRVTAPASTGQPSNTSPAIPAPGTTGGAGLDAPGAPPEPAVPLVRTAGEPLARLRVPSLDVDKVVVGGVAVDDLRNGPGHFDSTALPGHQGNVALAGHRTTYGAPFEHIDRLEPGDEIVVTTVQGEFTYRVMDPDAAFHRRLDDTIDIGDGHIIVDPGATWVLGDFNDDRLTLTACHPKFTARQRIIVSAELVGDPFGASAVDDATSPGGADEASRDSDPVLTSHETVAAPAVGPTIADNGDVVAATSATSATPTTPAIVLPSEPALAEPNASELVADPDAAAPGLRDGFGGERVGWVVAVVWLALAIAVWSSVGVFWRRLVDRPRRLPPMLVAAVPTAMCVWFCFRALDRALPAY